MTATHATVQNQPRKPTTQRRSELSARVLRTLSEIEAAKSDWLALEADAEGAIFFQSFAFCRVAASHAERNGAGRFFVCCVYDKNVLVGLLPLILMKKDVRTILTGFAEPFQQYTEMLVASGYDPVAIFDQIYPQIRASGADYVHLGGVRKTGPLHKAIDGRIAHIGAVEGAPVVHLIEWPDFETYFKTITAKTRKSMRNARNRLERTGTVSHTVSSYGDHLRAVIDRTYAGRADWLKRMGLTSRAFQNAGFSEFLDRFKAPEFTNISVLAMSLLHDDRPMADQWGFVHQGRYYAFMSTLDTAFEDSSPGRMHLGEVIKTCFEKGIKTADFLVPAVPYKATWARETVDVQDHMQPLSLLGRIYTIWFSVIRPLAKKLAYRMPRGLRKSVFRIVFKPADK